MSTWATKQEAVRAAVALAARMPDVSTPYGATNRRVEWQNRHTAQRYDDGTPWGDLVLMGVEARGQDETRYDFDAGINPAASRLVPTWSGYRIFTVSVRIGVDDQDPGAEAVGFLAGRFRTRLRRPDVLALIQAEDVALVDIGGTVQADYEDQGRVVSLAITEVRFATIETDTDADDSTGDYVATVQGDGDPEIDTVVLDVTA